ncbi:DUF4440 domain-containing protein [Mesorhizobium sp. M0659]|uniref:DUF4440 domain-containing protein n=1 Tax=Mesorhizobium sp. M0659 TaxID=2956980 RepID=UPI003337C1A2
MLPIMADGALLLIVEREIVEQHRFFVDWYNGQLKADDFARFEDSLAPGFLMLTTRGTVLSRPSVVAFVRANCASEPGAFAIDIQDVRIGYRDGRTVVATYFEIQHRGTSQTKRISTAVFSRGSTRTTGLVWEHLHETWAE